MYVIQEVAPRERVCECFVCNFFYYNLRNTKTNDNAVTKLEYYIMYNEMRARAQERKDETEEGRELKVTKLPYQKNLCQYMNVPPNLAKTETNRENSQTKCHFMF